MSQAIRVKFIATEVLDWIRDHLENAQYYREERAREYPEDSRNQEAVERIGVLIGALNNIGDSIQLFRLSGLWLQDGLDGYFFSEKTSQYFGRIGFDNFPDSAEEVFHDISEIMDEALARTREALTEA